MAKVIAVFGATGQQGGSVANALLDGGIFRVRAITRNPQNEAAQKLRARGAEVVSADLNNKASVVKALKGVYGCFGVTNFWPDMDKKKEKEKGIIIADACKQGGVSHLVYSGLEHVHKLIGIDCPHFDGKGEVEEYLQASTIPFTIVRVAGYSENFLSSFTPQKIGEEKYALFVPMADKEIPLISVAEIGECVHQIFQKRQQYLCKVVGLCSDNITMDKITEIMSRVLEKDIVDGQLTTEAFAQMGFPGADDMAAMFEFYQSGKYKRDPQLTRQLNANLSSFEQWVEANKEALLKTVPA